MPRHLIAVMFALFATQGLAQETDEVTFVRGVLSELQVQSIQENREYCGYIGYDDAGLLHATPAEPGDTDSCAPVWPSDLEVIASYHTHAGFDEEAYSETPSSTDMEADEADGIDGYVSTPGGRLWYIDTKDMIASQICGLTCLPSDADFVKGAQGSVAVSYAYQELIDLENAE